jgi:(1->4)-alpha-D-glucan 1-alpha-D-glucosylmutase
VQDEEAPDRSDEYIYYQALLGAWPAGQEEPTREFVDRMLQYLAKATKEKKVHTSWITPSPEYDAAVAGFIETTLVGTRAKPFLAQFLPFQKRVAELGMLNSLSQLTLKIASPGAPDIFQGSELWDLNLVDPDNRRPVDFTVRKCLLAKMGGSSSPATQLLADWKSGAVKLFVTSRGLQLRKSLPSVFLRGDYQALTIGGTYASNVVSFARTFDGQTVVAVAPRLITGVIGFESGLPLGSVWADTELDLGEFAGKSLRNVFTGEIVKSAKIAELFKSFPVALLTTGEAA